MILSIGDILRHEKTYLVIDETIFTNKTSFWIKEHLKNLHSTSRNLLNIKVQVKEITPETDPEYFI